MCCDEPRCRSSNSHCSSEFVLWPHTVSPNRSVKAPPILTLQEVSVFLPRYQIAAVSFPNRQVALISNFLDSRAPSQLHLSHSISGLCRISDETCSKTCFSHPLPINELKLLTFNGSSLSLNHLCESYQPNISPNFANSCQSSNIFWCCECYFF